MGGHGTQDVLWGADLDVTVVRNCLVVLPFHLWYHPQVRTALACDGVTQFASEVRSAGDWRGTEAEDSGRTGNLTALAGGGLSAEDGFLAGGQWIGELKRERVDEFPVP
jgi:hypothetical protein